MTATGVRRWVALGLTVGVCLAAGGAIVAVFDGVVDARYWRVVGSAMALVAAAVLAAPGLAAMERGQRALGAASALACVAAAILMVAWIWTFGALDVATGIALAWAGTGALVSTLALLVAGRDGLLVPLARATGGLAVLIAVAVSAGILLADRTSLSDAALEAIGRTVGAACVLLALGVLLCLYLRRLPRPAALGPGRARVAAWWAAIALLCLAAGLGVVAVASGGLGEIGGQVLLSALIASMAAAMGAVGVAAHRRLGRLGPLGVATAVLAVLAGHALVAAVWDAPIDGRLLGGLATWALALGLASGLGRLARGRDYVTAVAAGVSAALGGLVALQVTAALADENLVGLGIPLAIVVILLVAGIVLTLVRRFAVPAAPAAAASEPATDPPGRSPAG